MSLRKLNERHRKIYDSASAGNLVAALSTDRYTVETNYGMHWIYDTRPTEGEGNPLADMQHPLSERETRDRAAVNDAALPMPQRLAALNRMNTKKR